MTRASIVCCAFAASLMLVAKWTYQPLPRPQVSNAPCVLKETSSANAIQLQAREQSPDAPQAEFEQIAVHEEELGSQSQSSNAISLAEVATSEEESSVTQVSFNGFDGSDSPEAEGTESGTDNTATGSTANNETEGPVLETALSPLVRMAIRSQNEEETGASIDSVEPVEQRSAFDTKNKPLIALPIDPPLARVTRHKGNGRVPTTKLDVEPIDLAIQKKLSSDAASDRVESLEAEGTGVDSSLTTTPSGEETEVGPAESTTPNVASDEAGLTGNESTQTKELPTPPAPAVRPIEFSPQMRSLHDDIETCLAYYYARPENTKTRSPWGVMHSLIAFGVDTNVIVNGEQMNAIGWLTWNQPCRGMRLFEFDRNGEMRMPLGPGYQGHEGQLLAMLAQSKVKHDYPMKISGRDLTVMDLVKYEQAGCRPRTELTFKLIGLVHYLDTDSVWFSNDGQRWDFEKLLREELAQKVIGSACGGTHRMMGFTYAVKKREKEGKPMTGQWKRAREFVNAFHAYTFKLQNRDGSFSTKWFEGREAKHDIDRRIQTTGHILEWMLCSLPKDQLQDPRIVRAVQYLTYTMWRNRGHEWEIGPQGHALHALVLYNELVFQQQPGDGGQHLMELARRKGFTR